METQRPEAHKLTAMGLNDKGNLTPAMTHEVRNRMVLVGCDQNDALGVMPVERRK